MSSPQPVSRALRGSQHLAGLLSWKRLSAREPAEPVHSLTSYLAHLSVTAVRPNNCASMNGPRQERLARPGERLGATGAHVPAAAYAPGRRGTRFEFLVTRGRSRGITPRGMSGIHPPPVPFCPGSASLLLCRLSSWITRSCVYARVFLARPRTDWLRLVECRYRMLFCRRDWFPPVPLFVTGPAWE